METKMAKTTTSNKTALREMIRIAKILRGDIQVFRGVSGKVVLQGSVQTNEPVSYEMAIGLIAGFNSKQLGSFIPADVPTEKATRIRKNRTAKKTL